ncbi:MAG: GNAT family N-acetyltransferase [Burkholderiales bacterium]|nr:GNAT family N-acetyltransferase [Burkholderiales bacterium]
MQIEDQAIRSTFVEMFRSYQIIPVTQPNLRYDPQAITFITQLNEIYFNGICLKQPLDNLNLIEELKELHNNLNEPLIVWVTPETQSAEIEEVLQQHFETPGPFYGMLLDLDAANTVPCPDRVTVEIIKTREQAYEFANIFCEVFCLPNITQHILDWTIIQAEMEDPVCINYCAKLDGVIAGISSLVIDRKFNHFKTGGLYNVFVFPECRGHGVATAIACAQINLAKQLGLEHLSVLLMPDAMARGYSQLLGFKDYGLMTPYYVETLPNLPLG